MHMYTEASPLISAPSRASLLRDREIEFTQHAE
jgi:hypothetical protein